MTQIASGHPTEERAPKPAPSMAWDVVVLAMGPAVALGLGRFAYALILPAMRADLGWSYADAGLLGTANALGYLMGALGAARIGSRMGDRNAFAAGLFATALAVTVSGSTSQLAFLLVLRWLTGATGAVTFILGAALTSRIAARCAPGLAHRYLGIYAAGAGGGIVASALILPPLISSFGWRWGWIGAGALCLACCAFAIRTMRRIEDPRRGAMGPVSDAWRPGKMTRAVVSYGLFGAGYIVYATFIVAHLRNAAGLGDMQVVAFWAILGASSVAAAFAWPPLLVRCKGSAGVAMTMGVCALGALTALVIPGMVGAVLSALLFGGSFLAVVAAITAFARGAAPPGQWTRVIALFTASFGVGQCLGPVISGILSDRAGGVVAGLWLSVAILFAASVVAKLQGEALVTVSQMPAR